MGFNATSAPPLRKVPANILSTLGWLHGTFHVPEYQSLMDYFVTGVNLLKCTRVRLPHEAELIPFLALRREAVSLIEPTLDDERVETPGSTGRTSPRQVGCLFSAGLLRGTLEVLINVRLSDFLRQQPPMLLLRQCVLSPLGEAAAGAGAGTSQPRKIKLAIVNWAQALGISEWSSA